MTVTFEGCHSALLWTLSHGVEALEDQIEEQIESMEDFILRC